jgi:succinate-semialdehyde dehydrogenase/glutarate-semialdehyde dehydrogenase
MGKLYKESLEEVELSASIIDYYAENAESFLAPERVVPIDPSEGAPVVVSEPLGVLLAVEPWNFPYYQLARVSGPQLMAGNVLMVKHSPNVPQCAAAFETLYREAGAPDGAYTNIYATNDQIGRLIDDPRIAAVAFTGSPRTGSILASRAGKNLKKSTMELGSNDAMIVLADADLDRAVQWALWGRMNNGGQCCIAVKRFIVVDEIADRFFERLKAAFAQLNPGDPFDPETTLPPMSTQEAADQLEDQIKAAVDGGATATPLGPPPPETGAFVQPTMLTEVTSDNPMYHEEFFGPVAMCFRARSEEEAVRLANDSPYGLGGCVFTQDTERGFELARRLDTGMVFVNHPTWTKADLPFGGVKQSGWGRELGRAGMDEFVNKKLINVVPIDAPA